MILFLGENVSIFLQKYHIANSVFDKNTFIFIYITLNLIEMTRISIMNVMKTKILYLCHFIMRQIVI